MTKRNLLKTDPKKEIQDKKINELKKSEKQMTINEQFLDALDKEVVFSFRTKDSKREKIKRLAGIRGKTTEELMNDLMDKHIEEMQSLLNMIDNKE